MGQFILQYRGKGVAPSADLDKIQQYEGIQVIDSMPKMVLVKAMPASVTKLITGLGDAWSFTSERKYQLPDTRPRVLRGV